ncbi:single-stranded DNA-binding protein [Candidatus Peregrinibacteria bacterium]|nr:single-stranded DNA-binding protein [Candidatus Peregrinibacteria bacterium]
MYALNRVQLVGYLTQNPEIRQTPNGQTVGDLNLMTRQSFTRSDGEHQESKAFHSVVVWRGLADIAGRFLKQGSQVYVSGRMQTDEWQDPQGNRRYKTRIVADEMILLDPREPVAASNVSLSGALNRAEVLGNVSRDPELRQTPSGTSVGSFGVATNFSWKNRQGESQEKTEFHNVVVWGPLAQQVHQSIKKGRKVYVAGRIQTRSWETPDGQRRYATEIIADQVMYLGVYDSELGAPSGTASAVSVPVTVAATGTGIVAPENPAGPIPAIDYASEIKPEDLPF